MAKWAEKPWQPEDKDNLPESITASAVLREAADLKDLKSKDYQGSTWT